MLHLVHGMESPNIQVVKLAAQILVILDQNLYLVIAHKIKLRFLLQNAVQLATHAKQNTRIVIIARQATQLLALTDIHQPPANVVLVEQHRVHATNVMQAIPILIIAHQDIQPLALMDIHQPPKNVVLAVQHPVPVTNVIQLHHIPTLTLARPDIRPAAAAAVILKPELPARNALLAVQHQEPAINVPKRILTLTLARQDIRPAAAAAVILKPEPPAKYVLLAEPNLALVTNAKRNHVQSKDVPIPPNKPVHNGYATPAQQQMPIVQHLPAGIATKLVHLLILVLH